MHSYQKEVNLHALTARFTTTLRGTAGVTSPASLLGYLHVLQHRVRVSLCSKARPSPFLVLPPSVLVNIALYLDLAYRIRLVELCKTIRDFLMELQELWSGMSLRLLSWEQSARSSFVDGSTRLLRRSRIGAVRLDLVHRADEIATILGEHLFRLKTLDVALEAPVIFLHRNMPSADGGPDWQMFADSLCRPAPNLEQLTIGLDQFQGVRWKDDKLRLPADIFDNQPARLRQLAIRDVSLYHNLHTLQPEHANNAFSGVRSFTWASWNRRRFLFLQAEDLVVVLSVMHALEHLAISFRTFSPFTGNDNLVAFIKRSRLQKVALGMFAEPSMLALMRVFRSVAELHTVSDYGVSPEMFDTWDGNNIEVSLSPSMSTAKVHLPSSSRSSDARSAATTTESEGDAAYQLLVVRTYSFFDSIGAEIASFGPGVATVRVTSVTLHEFQWPQLAFWPSLPCCTTLTIIMATCLDYWQSPDFIYEHFTALGASLEFPATPFPALTKMCIYSGTTWWIEDGDVIMCQSWFRGGHTNMQPSSQTQCSCRTGLTLSLLEISQKIAFLIGQERRLDSLTIAGLRAAVDMDPAAAVEALYSVAKMVDFFKNPPKAVIEESRVEYNRISRFSLDYFNQSESTPRATYVGNTLPRRIID